jgi:hypothetical protein
MVQLDFSGFVVHFIFVFGVERNLNQRFNEIVHIIPALSFGLSLCLSGKVKSDNMRVKFSS